MDEENRLKRLAGRTRGERLMTVSIVAALGIAAVAFFALDTDDESTGPGNGGASGEPAASAESETAPELQSLDEACLNAKLRLSEAGARASEREGDIGDKFAPYGERAAEVVGGFRAELAAAELEDSAQRTGRGLERALRELERGSAQLAESAKTKDAGAIQAAFEQAEAASAEAELLTEELGLTECAKLEVGLTRVELEE